MTEIRVSLDADDPQADRARELLMQLIRSGLLEAGPEPIERDAAVVLAEIINDPDYPKLAGWFLLNVGYLGMRNITLEVLMRGGTYDDLDDDESREEREELTDEAFERLEAELRERLDRLRRGG